MKDELKELLKEQKETRDKLKTEIELKGYIARKTKIPFKIYIGGLKDSFGYSGSIKFKDLFRQDNLNKKELNELLDLFKAEKTFLCGGNSFKVIEDKKESCIKVNPYLIKYEGLNEDIIKIIWFSKIKGLVYEIESYINNRDFINEFAQRTFNRVDFKGGYRVENTKLHIPGNFSDGQYKSICWARGQDIYPNDFTIYTENLDTDFREYLNT